MLAAKKGRTYRSPRIKDSTGIPLLPFFAAYPVPRLPPTYCTLPVGYTVDVADVPMYCVRLASRPSDRIAGATAAAPI